MTTTTTIPRAGWEEVASTTWRLKVPGGWLYETNSHTGAKALAFVPEHDATNAVNLSRLANHLDDIAATLNAIYQLVKGAR